MRNTDTESFVFDGQEVIKTGRIAKRPLREVNGQKRELTLVEIKPLDDSLDWKKWVDPSHLYTIE